MSVATGASQGTAWPPEESLPRLRVYHRNALLFQGDHEAVFLKEAGYGFKFDYDDSRDYVAVNMLGALSMLLANRTFGEPTAVTAPEGEDGTQAFFEHLAEENRLHALNIEACLGLSYRGDSVYKVRYDAAAQRIVVDAVAPERWMPETAEMDKTDLVACDIGTILKADESHVYLWLERHELRDGDGWITNRLFRLHGDYKQLKAWYDPVDDAVALDTLAVTAGLAEEQATGVDALLVVHVPNRTTAETGIFGLSDYVGLLTNQGETNNRLTQRAEVLDKFVDPVVYGPDLSEDEQVLLRENKYLAIPPGGSAPAGYLVWDAQLAAVVEALDELRQDFASTAGIDLSAVRPQQGVGAASGRALRIGQMRTEDKVHEKQRTMAHGLSRVYSVASKLAYAPDVKLAWSPEKGKLAPVEPTQVDVQFGASLPSLRIEEIEEQVLALEHGFQDRVSAAMSVYGLTREAAEAKIEAVVAEAKAAAPTSPIVGGLGPPFERVSPGEE